jgi:hypothetical protein
MAEREDNVLYAPPAPLTRNDLSQQSPPLHPHGINEGLAIHVDKQPPPDDRNSAVPPELVIYNIAEYLRKLPARRQSSHLDRRKDPPPECASALHPAHASPIPLDPLK